MYCSASRRRPASRAAPALAISVPSSVAPVTRATRAVWTGINEHEMEGGSNGCMLDGYPLGDLPGDVGARQGAEGDPAAGVSAAADEVQPAHIG